MRTHRIPLDDFGDGGFAGHYADFRAGLGRRDLRKVVAAVADGPESGAQAMVRDFDRLSQLQRLFEKVLVSWTLPQPADRFGLNMIDPDLAQWMLVRLAKYWGGLAAKELEKTKVRS